MSCKLGKKCFDTEAEAKNFARKRMRRIGGGNRHRVYYCDSCAAYHLTTQETGHLRQRGKKRYVRKTRNNREY